MDSAELIRRLNTKTPDEMAPFQGKCVAWAEDGSKVLASATDLELLYQEIDRLGLTHYVIEDIPPPDEDFLGGATA